MNDWLTPAFAPYIRRLTTQQMVQRQAFGRSLTGKINGRSGLTDAIIQRWRGTWGSGPYGEMPLRYPIMRPMIDNVRPVVRVAPQAIQRDVDDRMIPASTARSRSIRRGSSSINATGEIAPKQNVPITGSASASRPTVIIQRQTITGQSERPAIADSPRHVWRGVGGEVAPLIQRTPAPIPSGSAASRPTVIIQRQTITGQSERPAINDSPLHVGRGVGGEVAPLIQRTPAPIPSSSRPTVIIQRQT
ncbi:MAG: hypothetical protein MUF87_20165, partial [Anaerolineae bacterium]|nr:hypothetical protein [Anaerolineae bacterium]